MTESKRHAGIAPHILIAIDGSPQSRKALDYTVRLTRLIPDLQLDLLYVLPEAPPFFRSEAKTDGQMRKRLKQLEAANRKKGEKILEEAKEYLNKNNFDSGRVSIKLRRRFGGLAKDILTEAEQGRYDALVIGRRGKTRAQELFMGSVTNQLIQHATNIPLWINEGQTAQPKILAAVDGSEASLRAVDHLAFILGRNPEATVDFLHVIPKMQSFCAIDFKSNSDPWSESGDVDLENMEEEFRRVDHVCLDDFVHKAVQILSEAGFSQDRIQVVEKEVTLGVARTIVREAKEGRYGTIVLGRRGLNKSSFLGSVSDKVIRSVEDKAVWLIS